MTNGDTQLQDLRMAELLSGERAHNEQAPFIAQLCQLLLTDDEAQRPILTTEILRRAVEVVAAAKETKP